jgi:hypothetical protein
MVSFSTIYEELISNIRDNRDTFIAISKNSNSNLLYHKLAELVSFTGSRHNLLLQLHFPNPSKLNDIDSYGSENISVVIDKFRKKFYISKEAIRANASKFLGTRIQVHDAYAYEGKEGLRIISEKGRIEILPGSIHIWCKIDGNDMKFLDWLMENQYQTIDRPGTIT